MKNIQAAVHFALIMLHDLHFKTKSTTASLSGKGLVAFHVTMNIITKTVIQT